MKYETVHNFTGDANDMNHWYTIKTPEPEGSQWLIDSGFPFNHHTCNDPKEFVNLDGKKEPMDNDGHVSNSVCEMLDTMNVDGILGGRYLADKFVKLSPENMTVSRTDDYSGQCVTATNEKDNYTSITVNICHDNMCKKTDCFLDTGGRSAFINLSTAKQLDIQAREAGIISSGAGNISTYVAQSPVFLTATDTDGNDVDLSTDTQLITDDHNPILNVIKRTDDAGHDMPFQCSIGTETFKKFDDIYFAKPAQKVCFSVGKIKIDHL